MSIYDKKFGKQIDHAKIDIEQLRAVLEICEDNGGVLIREHGDGRRTSTNFRAITPNLTTGHILFLSYLTAHFSHPIKDAERAAYILSDNLQDSLKLEKGKYVGRPENCLTENIIRDATHAATNILASVLNKMMESELSRLPEKESNGDDIPF